MGKCHVSIHGPKRQGMMHHAYLADMSMLALDREVRLLSADDPAAIIASSDCVSARLEVPRVVERVS